MSLEEMSFRITVLKYTCYLGEMPFLNFVILDNCHFDVILDNCHEKQLSFWTSVILMSFWTTVTKNICHEGQLS